VKGITAFNVLILGSFAALVSSCGNMYGTTSYEGSSSAISATSTSGLTGSSSGGSLSTVQQGKYTCPALDSPNVTPQYNVASTINGYFRVCTDPSSNTDVMVDGTFGNSDEVCVFPLVSSSVGGSTYAYWEENPSTGDPWYICQAGSSSGTAFTFSSLTSSWNAAYIVDSAYVTQMENCLMYGAGTAECPNYPQYSYGSI
jgi:hypothetical protein